jgi:acetyl esterase/lipase
MIGLFAWIALAVAAPAPVDVPSAIFTDPAPDKANPASMEVLHIPSGGVRINGVAYLPAGAGPHPILVIFHGLPGNEKNLDLAQTARRAGWTVVTLNYRGSWGSPGAFRFANCLEDAKAALAYLRDPANAKPLRADPSRIVIAGHSMGGWVTAMTAAEMPGLKGAILISAANMGAFGQRDRPALVKDMAADMESLADTSAERMADELIAKTASFDWTPRVSSLARTPLLVLSSDDGLAPETDKLIVAAKAAGGTVATVHAATDHGWSDNRIRLETEILRWLEPLGASKP